MYSNLFQFHFYFLGEASCTCLNGIAAIGSACVSDGDNICESCLDGYYLDGNICSANECICSNGNRATESACTENGENICESCFNGYYLDGNMCSVNECTCSHGNTATGWACTENGAHICSSCTGSYHLNGNICIANECTCVNGNAATESECTWNAANICASCNDGYDLYDADKICILAVPEVAVIADVTATMGVEEPLSEDDQILVVSDYCVVVAESIGLSLSLLTCIIEEAITDGGRRLLEIDYLLSSWAQPEEQEIMTEAPDINSLMADVQTSIVNSTDSVSITHIESTPDVVPTQPGIHKPFRPYIQKSQSEHVCTRTDIQQ